MPTASRRRPVAALLASLLVFAAGAARPAWQTPLDVVAAARVAHAPIDEMSGIVASRAYPGVYWVHNDSGDTARLFAIRADGTALMPAFLGSQFYIGPEDPARAQKPYPGVLVDGAANFDWEDIATDGDQLYVSDLGNNGNARRDLGIYVLAEPNPLAVDRAHILKRIPVAYPDQKAFPDPQDWRFDCEAIFFHRGKIHVLTKHRAPGQIGIPQNGTKLYRLDSQRTDRVNVLKKLDSLPDLGGWVTGADVSPDGRTLAVLCHAPVASVWLFDLRGAGDRMLSGPARRLVLRGADQCEAVCFENDGALLVTNEQRQIFRLPVSRFEAAEPPRNP